MHPLTNCYKITRVTKRLIDGQLSRLAYLRREIDFSVWNGPKVSPLLGPAFTCTRWLQIVLINTDNIWGMCQKYPIPHSVGLDIDLPGNYYPPTQDLRNREAFRKGVEAWNWLLHSSAISNLVPPPPFRRPPLSGGPGLGDWSCQGAQ